MGNLCRFYSWARNLFSSKSYPHDVRTEFEKLFEEHADPWNYTSSYEQTKYERTLSVIPDGIGSALEIGCAEGHFTFQLAPRVSALTAYDIANAALQRAAIRCASFPHVRFSRLDVAIDRIPDKADLIVCSEMLYYVGSVEILRRVAKKIALALNPHGYLVMAHMNLLVDDPERTGFDWQLPFGARVIGDVFHGQSLLRLVKEIHTPLYRIQLFQRISWIEWWFGRENSTKIFLNDEPANLEPDVATHVRWMS